MDKTRRNIVIGLPLVSTVALVGCGGGGSQVSEAAALPAGGNALKSLAAQAAVTQQLIQITNTKSGNFPVEGSPAVFGLPANSSLTQAVLNNVGNENTTNLLSLNLSCLATINNVPTIVSLVLTINLGFSVPTILAANFALSGGTSSIVGPALFVATQTKAGSLIPTRQAWSINGGSVSIFVTGQNSVLVALNSVTAVADSNAATPSASGSISASTVAVTTNSNGSTTTTSSYLTLNLAYENTGADLA